MPEEPIWGALFLYQLETRLKRDKRGTAMGQYFIFCRDRMQAAVSVKKLQEIMDLVTRFVSKHATLPILENVYIKASLDGLIFRAADMEKYIELELDVRVADEAAVTVNAKTLSDLLRTIEEEMVTLGIDQQKDIVTLTSSQDTFQIRGIPAIEYVAVPQVTAEHTISLDAAQFAMGVGKVEYAVTEKNFSPVLTGIYVRTKTYDEKKKLVFVGTDSFRLAEYKIDFPTSLDQDFALLIPKMHIADIKKVMEYFTSQWGVNVEMHVTPNMVSFVMRLNDMKLQVTTLLIQGTFPEYEKESIMPTNFVTTAHLDKTQLDKAIRKISILTRDLNNFISLQVGAEQTITMTSGQTDMGEGSTQVPATISGGDVKLGVNGKYLADFVRSAQWSNITLLINDSEKPILCKDDDDQAYTYVVRPLVK